jgi:type I restriction enzyme S subunit
MKVEIKRRIEAIKQGEVPKGYKKTKGMLYPDKWDFVQLNSVLKENKERNRNGKYSYEDVLSVSGELGITNQIELLGRSYAGKSVANYHIVNSGNIVYTKSPLKNNPYGIIKLNKGIAGIVSTLYAVYSCEKPSTGKYLDYYFSNDTFLNNYLRPLVKKGAKNDMKVNNEYVISGFIPFPSHKEQVKIIEILGVCEEVINLKKNLLSEKSKLKRWLLENLLNPDSGVRLPGFMGK